MFAPRSFRRSAVGHTTLAAAHTGRGIRRNVGIVARRRSKVRRAPRQRPTLAAPVRARTRYRSLGPARKHRSRNFSNVSTHLRRRSKTKSPSSPNPRPHKILHRATQPASITNRHSPLPPLSPNEARTPPLARPHLENPVRSRRYSSRPGFLAVPPPRDLHPHDKYRYSLKTFPPARLCPPRLRSGSVSDYATHQDSTES